MGARARSSPRRAVAHQSRVSASRDDLLSDLGDDAALLTDAVRVAPNAAFNVTLCDDQWLVRIPDIALPTTARRRRLKTR